MTTPYNTSPLPAKTASDKSFKDLVDTYSYHIIQSLIPRLESELFLKKKKITMFPTEMGFLLNLTDEQGEKNWKLTLTLVSTHDILVSFGGVGVPIQETRFYATSKQSDIVKGCFNLVREALRWQL